jgi:hypothetical protein
MMRRCLDDLVGGGEDAVGRNVSDEDEAETLAETGTARLTATLSGW